MFSITPEGDSDHRLCFNMGKGRHGSSASLTSMTAVSQDFHSAIIIMPGTTLGKRTVNTTRQHLTMKGGGNGEYLAWIIAEVLQLLSLCFPPLLPHHTFYKAAVVGSR